MNSAKILEKASNSKFHLWLLNQSLARTIPFNKPHKFSIQEVDKGRVKMILPYRKSNFNHIKGIHACALATCAEFATGFTLLSSLSMSKYRLIMKRINMEYFYQAKMDVVTEFEMPESELQTRVIIPVEQDGVTEIDCEIKLYDTADNHIATGNVLWHIKSWEKVKTKV